MTDQEKFIEKINELADLIVSAKNELGQGERLMDVKLTFDIEVSEWIKRYKE